MYRYEEMQEFWVSLDKLDQMPETAQIIDRLVERAVLNPRAAKPDEHGVRVIRSRSVTYGGRNYPALKLAYVLDSPLKPISGVHEEVVVLAMVKPDDSTLDENEDMVRLGARFVPAVELGDATVDIIPVGRVLAEHLAVEPTLIHGLLPNEFEELICERLSAMGLEARRVGGTYQKDGGIDIVFWPRDSNFPFLGAAQVRHHRTPRTKEGVRSVRDFAGAIAGHPFGAGIIVTNTSFTADAEWFARERAKLIRLRGYHDVRRWLLGDFTHDAEWREIPECIQLCPGVTIDLRKPHRPKREG